MRWLSFALASAVFISGCATYPDAVKVADGTPLVSYQAATQGKVQTGMARWSGVIAKVENNANNTRLEVVPDSILGAMMGFKQRPLLEAAEFERAAVSVSLAP